MAGKATTVEGCIQEENAQLFQGGKAVVIDRLIRLPLSPAAFEKNKSKFEKTLNLFLKKLVVLTNMTSRVLLQITVLYASSRSKAGCHVFIFSRMEPFGGYHKDFVCLGGVRRVFQNLSFAYVMPICQRTVQHCSKPITTCLT
jgi:hypothetical protein